MQGQCRRYGFVPPHSTLPGSALRQSGTRLTASRQNLLPRSRGCQYQRIGLLGLEAGWHTREQVGIPRGVQRVCLPWLPPALQPAERLWPRLTSPWQIVPSFLWVERRYCLSIGASC
ncbi:MAG TPA: hypothetical protein V6D03_15285 [Candidatus Caenarcaniphilales bacterium]